MALKTFWQRLKYWQRGFLIGISLVLSSLLFLILIAAISYNGKCEDLGDVLFSFPLGGNVRTYECSFTKHMMASPSIWVIYLPQFWWLSLIIVLIITIIGYYMDK